MNSKLIGTILCQFFLLCACTSSFELSIENDNGTPVFCISYTNRPDCSGQSNHLDHLLIEKMDRAGRVSEQSWLIFAKPGQFTGGLKKIKYGELPTGWEEISSVKTIEENAFYLLNGTYVFVKNKNSRFFVLDDIKYIKHKKPKDQIDHCLDESESAKLLMQCMTE